MAEKKQNLGRDNRQAIANLTGERLKETLATQVRSLLNAVGNFESQVRRFTANTEVTEYGSPTIHTRAPASPVGLFSVGDLLVAAFDVDSQGAPEIADLLRVYTQEGRSLRLSPNPLAHHKALTRWVQELYLSHRGRVHFVEVIEEKDQAILAFEVHHGAGRGIRRHLLGLDLSQGLDKIKLLRHPMPQDNIKADFHGFKELASAPWLPGERTNAYYHHSQVGPLFVFLEWGALKVRDYLELPRGTADLVIEATADADHSVNPDKVERLPSANPNQEVFCRILPEEGRPPHFIYYKKQPRHFSQVDVSQIPGLSLPGRSGKISSMFLWAGGEMLFLGGLPATPVTVLDTSGPDRMYVFQHDDGAFTLHHFESNKRKVLHSFQNVRAFSITQSGHLYFFSHQPDSGGAALEHTLGWYLTPFKGEDPDFSQRQQKYLRSFDPESVLNLGDAARLLQEPIEEENYREARDQLDQILINYPFVERAEDIRGALQALFSSLSKVTAIEAELSDIHDKRREALADFEEEAETTLQNAPIQGTRPLDARVKDLRAIRTLLGHLERLSQEKNRPSDVVEQSKALNQRLKKHIQDLSEVGASAAQVDISAIGQSLEKTLGEVPELDNLIVIEEALQKVRQDRLTLRHIVEHLSSLDIDAKISLSLAQEGTTAVVGTDRLEKALVHQRKGLSQNERHEAFRAYTIQLDLRIATEPGACQTVDECDGHLDAIIAQIEATKGEFADFPTLTATLDERLASARRRFDTRKLIVVQEREEAKESLTTLFNLRLSALSVAARSTDLDPQALEGFFATHPEATRCQDILSQLREIGLEGQASRLNGQLDTARRGLVSQRQEHAIFSIEGEKLRLGGVTFIRNRLTLGVQERFIDGALYFQVAGTQMQIPGEALGLVSPDGFTGLINENQAISRVEYLAFRILKQAEQSGHLNVIVAEAKLKKEAGMALLEARCKTFALAQAAEEHTLGLHDRDAAEILRRIAPLWVKLGPLSYPPSLRIEAIQLWKQVEDGSKIAKAAAVMTTLGKRLGTGISGASRALKQAILSAGGTPSDTHLAYLIAELELGSLGEGQHFAHHPQAMAIANAVRRMVGADTLKEALKALPNDKSRLDYLTPEVKALLQSRKLDLGEDGATPDLGLAIEASWLLITEQIQAEDSQKSNLKTRLTIRGLTSNHPRTSGNLVLDLPLWYGRLNAFFEDSVPSYVAFSQAMTKARKDLAGTLELSSLIPKPLARFAWTRLLQQVYLPLIAKALEKQLGSLENPGIDQMGLLLLVSPPGYGKTEILKKVASLLGFGFVSISGTALGQDTVSLDPDAAPNKAAAAALDRLIRGLELGDNLIVDIEDIHACSEAFLEKLLPLCDATRTVEVARNGELKQISLQGQRVAIVMTLNPLRANIPQALANRATLINLGDVSERYGDAFALSYLEVAAPSNKTLEPISANRDLVTLAQALSDDREWDGLGRDLNGRYARAELRRVKQVLTHAVAIRDVLVAVNTACLKSAMIEDSYRDTPAFELQGSYRDMVEISRRIEADWTDDDRRVAILNHYEGQAGLLASQGEANLLTLKAMLGQLDEENAARLEHIRHTFKLKQAREQTLLTLLDRLTDVSEAVQRVPAAVNAHGEHLSEQLNRAIEQSTSMHSLGDKQHQSLVTLLSSLQRALSENRLASAAHLNSALEQGAAYLFGDADTLSLPKPSEPRPEIAQSLDVTPSPIKDVPVVESEKIPFSQGVTEQPPSDVPEAPEEHPPQPEEAPPAPSIKDPTEETHEPGYAFDYLDAYADADPATFIARLLEAEANNDARKKAEEEQLKPEETRLPADETPIPADETPIPAEAPFIPDNDLQSTLAQETAMPTKAVPPPSGLDTPALPDAAPQGPGVLTRILTDALKHSAIEVKIAHGEEAPPWSMALGESLESLREDVARLANFAENKPKTDLLSSLKSLLKALPDGDS